MLYRTKERGVLDGYLSITQYSALDAKRFYTLFLSSCSSIHKPSVASAAHPVGNVQHVAHYAMKVSSSFSQGEYLLNDIFTAIFHARSCNIHHCCHY